MSAKPCLTLTIEEHGDTAIILCYGKLLAGETDLLHVPVAKLTATHKHIIVDLGALTQMDSMGLGALVRLYVSSKNKGCTFELRNLGKKVNELLIVTKLLPVFSIVGEHRTWI